MQPQEPPTGPMGPWEPPPQPQPPPRQHHWYRPRNILLGAGALIVGIVAGGLAAGSGHQSEHVKSPPPHNYNTPAATTTSAAPAPSPDGTFEGSCDYTLGSSPATGTAVAIGDIQADNTGNVGIKVHLTISWPQEGYGPLKLSKTIRLGYGQSQDVQFHLPLTGTQLDRLQSYQLSHTDTGCKYNGEMTDTFGQPH